jgi:hypothetical protein
VRRLLLRTTRHHVYYVAPRSSFSQCGDRSEAPVLISRRSDDDPPNIGLHLTSSRSSGIVVHKRSCYS